MSKPYQSIPIQDCGEPLVPIPLDKFTYPEVHAYQKLGADYGDRSPYMLRSGIVDQLLKAQAHLEQKQPGWKIYIFDAYRPIAVQQFMVEYTFNQLLQKHQAARPNPSMEEKEALWEQVYRFWAAPSSNPLTPPPHSTGAAVDVTLMNDRGKLVNMGGEIDDIALHSYPDHYEYAVKEPQLSYHSHRQILRVAMESNGFVINPNEWWHFSAGDQLAVWRQGGKFARYGRI
jgi:D-alanyl-D-alanine dipeptidase